MTDGLSTRNRLSTDRRTHLKRVCKCLTCNMQGYITFSAQLNSRRRGKIFLCGHICNKICHLAVGCSSSTLFRSYFFHVFCCITDAQSAGIFPSFPTCALSCGKKKVLNLNLCQTLVKINVEYFP